MHSSCRMLTMTAHSFAENQSELDCCHLKKLKSLMFGTLARLSNE